MNPSIAAWMFVFFPVLLPSISALYIAPETFRRFSEASQVPSLGRRAIKHQGVQPFPRGTPANNEIHRM